MASIERDETYETITVSLSFENFLSFLMGKRSTHGLAGQLSKHQWKQLLRRVNRYIVKAINLNVQTDSFHRSRIALALGRLDIATTKEQNSEYIFALLWLLFEVLGGRPDNWHRRTVNRPEYLRLNRCRSLAYIQSSYQKVATILEAAQYPPYSTIHKHEDLLVCWRKCQLERDRAEPDPALKFIDWYKKTYPDAYLSIF